MSFHLCQSKPPYKPCILLRHTGITHLSEVKFLRKYIMENPSCQVHISSLCHGCSKTYYTIISSKNILSNHMLWNTHFACFKSLLRYGIILSGGTRKCIQVVHIQKKVIRLITGIKNIIFFGRQKFKENKMLMVTSVYVLEVLCFVKRKREFEAKLRDP